MLHTIRIDHIEFRKTSDDRCPWEENVLRQFSVEEGMNQLVFAMLRLVYFSING